MKILFISPNELWGGAAIANITIAKNLLSKGHEVTYCDEYFPQSSYEGLTIEHIPFHSQRRSLKNTFIKYSRKQKFDLIIWSPAMTIYYYWQIRELRKLGIKHIAILHSLSLKQNIKGKVMDFLLSLTLSRLDALAFVSNFTLDSWMNFKSIRNSYAKKVVIYNSVEESEWKHHSELDKEINIGFVGRFSLEKQPDLFCSLSEISDYKFHTWGDGPLFDKVTKQYPKVIHHGLEKNIDNIYHKIDILVVTSIFENCPMVILESKIRGIPCVAPRVGGIPEIIDENDGVLYDNFLIEDIVCKINKITNDYENYSEHAIMNSKKYSVENISLQWEKLLQTL